MAKMGNGVEFNDGGLDIAAWNRKANQFKTPEAVRLSWANVNQHDEENMVYQVGMLLPVNADWVVEFKDAVTAWENSMRKGQGVKEADVASIFLNKDNQPRLTEDGEFWDIRASGKTNDIPYETRNGKTVAPFHKNKPRVYDVHGVQDTEGDIVVWAGDLCKVAASLGFYKSGSNYGTKLYIKGVQLIESAGGGSRGSAFDDESDAVDNGDDTDLPF